MSANPIIVDYTGYVGNGNDVWFTCLYTNDVKGVAKIRGSRYNSADETCYYDEVNAITPCFIKTENGLKARRTVLVNVGMLFNIGCIEVFPCVVGDNCVARTCSVLGSRSQYIYDVYIRGVNNSIPVAPANLLITPGDRRLNIQWNSVPGNIFAYYIAIFFEDILWTSGYALVSDRNVTISGLTNDAAYKIEVRALTHNNIASVATIGSGTPIEPCTSLESNMVIS